MKIYSVLRFLITVLKSVFKICAHTYSYCVFLLEHRRRWQYRTLKVTYPAISIINTEKSCSAAKISLQSSLWAVVILFLVHLPSVLTGFHLLPTTDTANHQFFNPNSNTWCRETFHSCNNCVVMNIMAMLLCFMGRRLTYSCSEQAVHDRAEAEIVGGGACSNTW